MDEEDYRSLSSQKKRMLIDETSSDTERKRQVDYTNDVRIQQISIDLIIQFALESGTSKSIQQGEMIRELRREFVMNM
jgi:voltage-gated potassium channel Kch